jgi:GNAT superfamily N-acetyltransferase
MISELAIRRATASDIDTLVAHRRGMFYDMGYRDEAALGAMSAKFRPWLRARMEEGVYLAWLVIAADGSVAAGAGLWLMDWPPHMVGAGARRGNILNVYTDHAHRGRGLARRLMDTAIAWCRDNGVDTVILHASVEGRPLYESMGFAATNEMRIML